MSELKGTKQIQCVIISAVRCSLIVLFLKHSLPARLLSARKVGVYKNSETGRCPATPLQRKPVQHHDVDSSEVDALCGPDVHLTGQPGRIYNV